MAVGALDIIIVNINGLHYTRGLVECLKRQTAPFRATIYDQASTESGTREYLDSLGKPFTVVYNYSNVDLNRLWNLHYCTSEAPYLAFLNNDILIPPNFVSDTVTILDKEQSVGGVIHSTNHPKYCSIGPLDYVVIDGIYQGWDFALRREVYVPIPDDLKTFGGDDWLFAKLYEAGFKVAVALSSPIVHYYAKSRKYYEGSRGEETKAWLAYGYPKLGKCPYSKRFPPKGKK